MTPGNQKRQQFSMVVPLAGFSVRLFTPLITRLHEWMHAIVAVLLGGRATEIQNASMRFSLPNMQLWHIVVLMAFWLEMGMYFAAGMILARPLAVKESPRMIRARRFVGKASAGIVPAVMIRALISSDFERVSHIYPLNEAFFCIVGAALCVMLLYRYYDGAERTAHRTRHATSASSARPRQSMIAGDHSRYRSVTAGGRRVPHDAVKCAGW